MAVSASNWMRCSTSRARLSSVEGIMGSYIDSDDRNFERLALHTVRKGGKKLRPSLYLLALRMGNYYDSELLHPAAALELIHIASLHHDDVMDQAELRRNSISVNSAFGNLDATYSGNYLFSKAVAILSTYGNQVNKMSCDYITELCLGQLKEAENAFNLNLSIDQHLEIIEKKTASLFEMPCKMGALLAHADQDTQQALISYGRNVGIAFQMIDDYLDLNGSTGQMGKKKGTDLKEGVYTYATLQALKRENGSSRLKDILLQEEINDKDIEAATILIENNGGLNLARMKAQTYIEKGLAALELLPKGKSRESLENLANYILEREN